MTTDEYIASLEQEITRLRAENEALRTAYDALMRENQHQATDLQTWLFLDGATLYHGEDEVAA